MQDNQTPDSLVIVLDDKPRELFMSFGMLHELIPIVGDLTRIGTIAMDTGLRLNVMNTLLAERNEKGEIVEELNVFNLKLSISDVQAIIKWVQGHLLSFFLEAIENAVETHKPHLDRLQTPWTPSGNGSPG